MIWLTKDAQLRRAELKKTTRKDAHPGGQVVLGQALIKEIDEGSRAIPFIVSTGDIDRHGDTLDPMGCQHEHYDRNPVVLWQHNRWELPVARGEGVTLSADAVRMVKVFAPAELNPKAELIYQMILAGFLRACSVGFWPLEWMWAEELPGDDGKERGMWDIHYRKWELLESSIVNIPANPFAEAEKMGAGVKQAVELMQDTYGLTLEQLVEQAKRAPRPEASIIDTPVDEPPAEPQKEIADPPKAGACAQPFIQWRQ